MNAKAAPYLTVPNGMGFGRYVTAAVLPCLWMYGTGVFGASPEIKSPTKTQTWVPTVSIAVKEEFDSNVYLQDIGTLGDASSFVTTVLPAVGLKYLGGPEATLSLSYAPEVAFFHSESSEDHVLHRVGLGGSGKISQTEWDVQNTLVVIDGSDEGLVFSSPGGAGAAGGPRVRDRRDATMYRGGVKVTQAIGKVLVRPVVSAYIHDWQTRHSAVPGYLNFVDRNDFNGGVDVGAVVHKGTRAFVGYRYGRQDQAKLLSYPEEYDNEYHRILFSLEGTPWKWLKAGISLGPEFRHYGDKVSPLFQDTDELNLFVDGSVTLTLGAADTVVLSVKQFEQPGFGGRSTYEDLTYDLTWRHKVGAKLTLSVVGRAYNTDFTYPTMRDDWVLSGGVAATYNLTQQLNAELSYTFEDGESRVPNTWARDYTREVVALGIKYVFK
ncbi:MAG: outer membrane beta-barrel protein [Verrucomicrobiales bacterium]|nr:outer membrane beta-barrel protein [Verrucomicrobiales bacterium]